MKIITPGALLVNLIRIAFPWNYTNVSRQFVITYQYNLLSLTQAHSEVLSNCRQLQSEIRDLKDQIENLRHELELSRDAISVADRKASAASHDAEEARTLLATSER